MKHLKIIFLSAILFLFSSCGSDKEILSEDNLEGEEFYYSKILHLITRKKFPQKKLRLIPAKIVKIFFKKY
jgi:hypothetical protein